ncbi:hypothetical protein Gotri_023874 [Gossypium trilobum]|uniref:Uncharacterized protein n=1 Tax=Gossypium trilobum TaxID=34281 RepID=A0A7J9DKU4_9ROSI|nr:hypothetical protein [Gossypium trilobum]
MDWFRHNGKLYLLPTLEKSRQCRRNMPRLGPINPRSREHVARGLTFALAPHKDLIAMQPLGHYGSHIFLC